MTTKIVDFEDGDEQVGEAAPLAGGFSPAPEPKWLIDPIEVPADDMPWEYTERGKEKLIYPQAGRTFSCLPVAAAGTQMLVSKLQLGTMMAQEAERNEDAVKAQAAGAMIVETADAITSALARVIIRWNLIGWDGLPLPQPYQRPDVLMNLPNRALAWLSETVGAVAAGTYGDTKAARGNGSRPSRRATTAAPRQRRASASR